MKGTGFVRAFAVYGRLGAVFYAPSVQNPLFLLAVGGGYFKT